MSQSIANGKSFHLDREHRGVRYSVILILLLSFLVAFVAIDAILSALAPQINTTVILACLGAIPICLGVSAAAEWYLKRHWHSGNTLTVTPDSISLRLGEERELHVDRHKNVNTLWWEITLAGYARGGRERRIPSKWFCVAGQLQQDDTRIVVYCYAEPQKRERWRERHEFVRLKPEDVYNTAFSSRFSSPDRPELPADVIAGKRGRHWLAERNRWREGVEMTQDDFEQFLEMVRSAHVKSVGAENSERAKIA